MILNNVCYKKMCSVQDNFVNKWLYNRIVLKLFKSTSANSTRLSLLNLILKRVLISLFTFLIESNIQMPKSILWCWKMQLSFNTQRTTIAPKLADCLTIQWSMLLLKVISTVWLNWVLHNTMQLQCRWMI